MKNKNFDTCVSFFLENGAFMGRMVSLDKVLNTILNNHNYPLNVSSALAETTTLAVLCSAMLKFDGLFTLQLQGDGPVSLLVADVTAEGKVRACAKFDENKLKEAKKLRKTTDIIEPTPHLIGGGYMALTVDALNGTPPYQGIVDLKGKNLSELALRYFKQSEQINTHLKLFLKTPDSKNKTFLSAGIILQKVPLKGGQKLDIDENSLNSAWEDANAFIESLKDDEVFDSNLSTEEILYRLFHLNNLQISGYKNFEFGCRCSKEKLQKTFSSFKSEDLDDMCNKKGQIEATCNFCGQKYVFDRLSLSKEEKLLH